MQRDSREDWHQENIAKTLLRLLLSRLITQMPYMAMLLFIGDILTILTPRIIGPEALQDCSINLFRGGHDKIDILFTHHSVHVTIEIKRCMVVF